MKDLSKLTNEELLQEFEREFEKRELLLKDTAMIRMELLRSKSEDEVYEYRLEVENFLAFFKEESKYLDVNSDEYESIGAITYITDNVFSNIAREVEKINISSTIFWEELRFKYLITFNQFYQDCEEVAMYILKQLKKYYETIKLNGNYSTCI